MAVRNGSIGDRMRAARERRGWSQSGVARILGVHRQVVYRAESGRFRPSLAWVEQYARAIGVPASELDGRLK